MEENILVEDKRGERRQASGAGWGLLPQTSAEQRPPQARMVSDVTGR